MDDDALILIARVMLMTLFVIGNKNVRIAGGLLQLAVVGPGRYARIGG